MKEILKSHSLSLKSQTLKPPSSVLRPRSGFTLIELLAVIAIITILTTVVLVVLGGARAGSRDKKRKADLQSVAVALDLAYSEKHVYPYSDSQAWFNSGKDDPWIPDNPTGGDDYNFRANYLSPLPKDPLNKDPNMYWYYSGEWSTGNQFQCSGFHPGQNYILVARLEKKGDSENIINTDYRCPNGGRFNGNDPSGGGGFGTQGDYIYVIIK